MIIKQRKHLVIVLIVFGCVVLLFGRLLAGQMRNYLQSLTDQLEQLRSDHNDANLQIAQNAEYVLRWVQIKGFQAEPIEQRQNDFTAYLLGLASERDFSFGDLGDPVGRLLAEDGRFQILRYQLSFYCDLEDLVEFLARLDSSQELLRVEFLRVSPRKTAYPVRYDLLLPGSRRGDLSVDMTVAIPAAASPAPSAIDQPLVR